MQIGGWAALLAAVAIPLEVAAVLVAQGSIEERLASPLFVAAESVRLFGFLVAAIGLDQWLREIHSRLGSAAMIAGVTGAGLGLVTAGWPSSAFDTVIVVVINGAIGSWLILAGAVVGRAGGDLRRIGWVGQLGGLGMLLTIASVLLYGGVPSQRWSGPGLFDYAQVLGVFAVVFLIRIWRFAAFGRLPHPGLI